MNWTFRISNFHGQINKFPFVELYACIILVFFLGNSIIYALLDNINTARSGGIFIGSEEIRKRGNAKR